MSRERSEVPSSKNENQRRMIGKEAKTVDEDFLQTLWSASFEQQWQIDIFYCSSKARQYQHHTEQNPLAIRKKERK